MHDRYMIIFQQELSGINNSNYDSIIAKSITEVSFAFPNLIEQ